MCKNVVRLGITLHVILQYAINYFCTISIKERENIFLMLKGKNNHLPVKVLEIIIHKSK